MRKAKKQRRRAGIMTLNQVAVEFDVPLSFVRAMAREGGVRVMRAGKRIYVHRSEADRVFGDPGAAA
jgi:hypothetical protein